ncbi:MAG: hypothetical protein WC408_03000 [Candidatus Micrarchaeia archaeon]|jgi:hypothetical protein
MAKVVLLWNEHPNENLAGYHARRCAKLLKDMGHEVILEKLPYKDTVQAKMLAGTPKQAAEALWKEHGRNCSGDLLVREYETKHGAPVFSFHTTGHDMWGEPEDIPPEKFKVWVVEHTNRPLKNEIQFLRIGNNFDVELPAVDHPISDVAKKAYRLDEVKNELVDIAGAYNYLQMTEHRPERHLFVNKLCRPEQKKYLAPILTEKIAKTIDEIIKKQGQRRT